MLSCLYELHYFVVLMGGGVLGRSVYIWLPAHPESRTTVHNSTQEHMRKGGLPIYVTWVKPDISLQLPDNLSLEAAVTVPDNFVCAFYTVFNQLVLPIPPSFPASEVPLLFDTPILIYGAGSTAGQYMIRLLHLAGYTRIFATASSRHHSFLRGLGATDLFDYNSPTVVDEINKAAGGPEKISLAVDCISAATTMNILAKVLSPTGNVALLLPVKEGSTLNNGPEDKLYSVLPLPEHLNPFQKGTNIIGVRTFLYQQVRMWAFIISSGKYIP